MKRVLVGLSGGVDSAVAAYLLQQQGFDVVGGFMINYTTDDETCTTKEDIKVAQEVAQFLGIKLHTFDFQEEYQKRIVAYIVESYRNGLTPNPDVLCNSEVKFKLFLEEGLAAGFDAVATGHYARIEQHDSEFQLLKGVDANKDQSYFLAGLSQEQLAKAIFPLGGIPKPEVREIAKQAGLPNADRKDSQGICFIGKVPMKQFLQQYIPVQKGNILDTSGKILGEHDGAWGYTIGQRKGIGVAAAEPLFVLKKNVKNNTITVGFEHEADLYSQDITVAKRHRIGKEYSLPFAGHAKIRYRQADQEMNVSQGEHGTLLAHFTQPQRAVASGQILVVYDGDIVVGSGIIE